MSIVNRLFITSALLSTCYACAPLPVSPDSTTVDNKMGIPNKPLQATKKTVVKPSTLTTSDNKTLAKPKQQAKTKQQDEFDLCLRLPGCKPSRNVRHPAFSHDSAISLAQSFFLTGSNPVKGGSGGSSGSNESGSGTSGGGSSGGGSSGGGSSGGGSSGGGSSGNSDYTTKSLIEPNNNMNFTQTPGESSFQHINVINTSKLGGDTALKQSVELGDVNFNQLNVTGSLHTINATIIDTTGVNGSLEQSFKNKKLEMIQSNSLGSTHALNYFGDK